MSLASVRSFLAENAPELQVIVSEGSTASVAEAAQQHGVEPGQIAKTLAFETSDGRRVFLVVARGDARIDKMSIRDKVLTYHLMVGTGMWLSALQIDLAGRPDGARAGRLRQLGGDYLQSLVGVEPARLRFGARGLQIQ